MYIVQVFLVDIIQSCYFNLCYGILVQFGKSFSFVSSRINSLSLLSFPPSSWEPVSPLLPSPNFKLLLSAHTTISHHQKVGKGEEIANDETKGYIALIHRYFSPALIERQKSPKGFFRRWFQTFRQQIVHPRQLPLITIPQIPFYSSSSDHPPPSNSPKQTKRYHRLPV